MTERGAGLGDGLDPGVVLGLVSGPVLAELDQEVIWPADVFSFERGAMIIQESTNARSPLSLDPNRIGGRVPVLASSAGRAFLAACNPQQREIILAYLPQLGESADQVFLKDGAYESILTRTVERGYAVRRGQENNRKTSSIGVPIVQGGAALGKHDHPLAGQCDRAVGRRRSAPSIFAKGCAANWN